MPSIDIISVGNVFQLTSEAGTINLYKQHIKEMLYRGVDDTISLVLYRNRIIYLNYKSTTTEGVAFSDLDSLWSWLQGNAGGTPVIPADALTTTGDEIIYDSNGEIITV